jgi:hypothetical protein
MYPRRCSFEHRTSTRKPVLPVALLRYSLRYAKREDPISRRGSHVKPSLRSTRIMLVNTILPSGCQATEGLARQPIPRLAAHDSNEATRPKLLEGRDRSHRILHCSRGGRAIVRRNQKVLWSPLGVRSGIQSANHAKALARIAVYLFVSHPAFLTRQLRILVGSSPTCRIL